MAKLVMVIDTKRCTGCHTCAMACKTENNLPDGVWWNQVFSGEVEDFTGDRSTFTAGKLQKNANIMIDVAKGEFPENGGLVNGPDKKNVTMNFYTKACQHCEDPACVKACPVGALYIDPVTGVVDTDFSKCIGCDKCIAVCPYDVRYHNIDEKYFEPGLGGQGVNKHKSNTVDKCTMCSHRLAEGLLPACVEQCPAQARMVGYISDPSSEVSQVLKKRKFKQLLPDSGTKPSIYFLY